MAVSRKKQLRRIVLLSLLIITIIIQFFRIDKTNPTVDETKDFLALYNLDENYRSIHELSCYDCHSNKTRYPWYTNIAPVSWWIKKHIDEGRGHLNFSEWGDYSKKKKLHKLEECIEYVEEEKMPLKSFTWVHKDAILSNKDRSDLIALYQALYKELDKQDSLVEAISRMGRKLYTIQDTEKTYRKKDSLLTVAGRALRKEKSLENYIWYGRRTAYMSKYNDAIKIFTDAMELFPDAPELYRHRGHRHISTRSFDAAIADLEKAASLMKEKPLEIEPDGIPNRLNKPLSSLQFNVWYHLGLAHFLNNDLENAKQAYLNCLETCNNDDLLVATSDWLYLTNKRLGDEQGAYKVLLDLDREVELIENVNYYQRLRFYANSTTEADFKALIEQASGNDRVTLQYGLANWYLFNNREDDARQVMREMMKDPHWSSFAYIAAEADLVRR